ncbi:MAG: T9SS type A sorting domain-containing protein [Melioribacteraceae bacterium]
MKQLIQFYIFDLSKTGRFMMTAIKNFFTLLLLIPTLSFTQVLKVENINGPFGGTFRSVKWDRNGIMFVACDGGLFTSTDNGLTWKPMIKNYYTSDSVNSLFIGPDGNLIFQKGDGVYSTTSDGYQTPLGNTNQMSLFGVDLKGQMYFTKFAEGIYVTSDSGKTFRKIRDTNSWGADFIVLKNNKLAYTHGAYIELSTNNGIDWTTQQPVNSDPGIGWSLAADSKGNLFLCTGKEIMRTSDFGNNWSKLTSPVQYPWSMHINSRDEILVCSQLKLYSSIDSGQNWNDEEINDYVLNYAEDKSGNMYAGTFHHLYKRDVNKKNWYEYDSGINQARINSITMQNGKLMIMTTKEIYTSPDMGLTWSKTYAAEYGSSRFYDFKNKDRVFAYIDGPINYSTDYGSTWTKISPTFPYDALVDIEITNKDEIFAASNRNTLNFSNDFGKTWQTIWKGAETYVFGDLTLDKEENLLFSYGRDVFKYDKVKQSITNIGYFENGVKKIVESQWGTIYAFNSDGLYIKTNTLKWNKIYENDRFRLSSTFVINKQNQIIIFNGNEIAISSDLGKNFIRYTFSEYLLNPISFYANDAGDYFIGTQEGGLYKATIPTQKVELPAQYRLAQNYPNPFNGQTYIELSLPKQAQVKVVVFNLLGQEIEVLKNETLPLGNYKLAWDSKKLASGVYLYKIQTPEFVETKKMILMK